MPPKKTAQRRSRKEILQEDLTKLIRQENMNDEEIFPILKEALNEGVDVDLVVANRSLICYFAFWGMTKCFEECFVVGADPTIVTSKHSSDALVCAVKGFASVAIGLRMVMFLLNHEKANDLDHQKVLDWACARGQFEVVRLYLRRDKSYVDKALWSGVCRGSRKLVEIAVDFSADVNQRISGGGYLIHMAAELQDSSILEKLLDAGADIEAKNNAGETPFEVAVRFNSVSCAKLLIARKCEVSNNDILFLAARCRSHDVLKDLLTREKFREREGKGRVSLLFAVIESDDFEAFRIVYSLTSARRLVISQLVRFQRYEMLSAALFEFEHPGLSVHHLTQFITEAPNDDFKTLLEKKIDAMNGVDLVAKVKKEAEEEGGEAAEDFQSTSETTKNKKK